MEYEKRNCYILFCWLRGVHNMIQIKKLDASHKSELTNLIKVVTQSIENPLWFRPFDENEIEAILIGDIMALGAFSDQNELMAISVLFPIRWHEILLGKNPSKTLQLGGCMTLPKFRGNSLMFKLGKALFAHAKAEGYTDIVATVHPDNAASIKTFLKLEMKYQKEMTLQEKFLRHIYALSL